MPSTIKMRLRRGVWVCVFVCTKKCVPQGENTHCSKLSPPFSAMAGAGWVLRPNMAQRKASHIGRFSPLRALALDFDFKNRAVFPQEKKKKKEYFGIIRRTKNKQQKSTLWHQNVPKVKILSPTFTHDRSTIIFIKQNMQC